MPCVRPAFISSPGTHARRLPVDDVAAGHLRAFHRGRVGERYILGGQDMMLREILAAIALPVGIGRPRHPTVWQSMAIDEFSNRSITCSDW
ncbi:MAG: hypothetical protein AUF64_05145 [Chloroflexi bacterium 13_1_20CM_54_36]|nr:MAG: hypothetical protein AUF64_05145 [Chloroflexi bacterium 13_1_20CM_54_36]